jgi:CRP/FNR family transcriptional regulator, cyclic AMP receptor protein
MREHSSSRRSAGHSDILSGLTTASREAVIARCKRRDVATGKALWSQGDPAECLAILLSGKVMSLFESRNGRSGTIGFWTAGDIIGLGDMGERHTRQHTVRCLESSSFLTLPYDRIDDLVLGFPEFGLALVYALSIRLKWVTQLALGLETGSAMERICTVLLALSERFGEPGREGITIALNLTNDQLAAIAGVTRQFANSTLKLLRERGFLSSGRQLTLTDIPALEQLAFS